MVKFALRNPYIVFVAALAIVVIGMTSYTKIPADLLPIFKTPAVQIVTFYPGMPPEIMERDIMSRIERWTGQSVGIEHQEGRSMLGVSVVKDFFREGISLETAMSQVTSYAMSDLYYLPPGTVPPMVMPFDPTASLPLCLVSVSSPGMNEKELYDVAYFELRNRLQSIQGVIAPAVYGGQLRRILSYVDREKLEARELSPMDVVRALQKQNVFIPAGNMKIGDLDYQIFANSMVPEVEMLNDIPIAIRDGAPILLRDVARAQDASQIQSNVVRINEKRQVYIPIYRQPGANTIEIVNSIRGSLEQTLARLREFNPKAKDLSLDVVLDQSVYVRNSVNSLQTEALLGALLAAGVVFLFLRRFGITLIASLSIPVSLLAAVIGLFYTGDTLNAMTLGGLALIVGIVVDQSIVVIENIMRRMNDGEDLHHAALHGTTEVARPVLISTLTFITVFYPVVFLTGMAKFLFAPLAIAAVFAIIGSYLVAITLIPVLCVRFLKLQSAHDHKEFKLARRYAETVKHILSRRRAVFVTVIALGVITLVLGSSLGRELYPPVDAKQFQMLVRLPSGTRIEHTEETVRAVERAVIELLGEPDPAYPKEEKRPESNLRILISNIGVLMDWPAAYTPNVGPMDAFVLVQLKGKRGYPSTFDYVSRLRQSLREKFPDVEFSFDTGGMLTAAMNLGEPAPIHLQVSGSNLHTNFNIAKLIKQEIEQVDGATDVRIAQRLDYPVLDVDIDRLKSAYAGINVEDVIKNLVTATNSSVGFNPAFWIDERNGNHYFIGAQYAEADLTSVETLLNIPVTSPGGREAVPLGNLVKIERSTGPAVINHMNITRVIDVYAAVRPGYDIGSVVAKIEQRLARSDAIKPAEKESARGVYYAVEGGEFAGLGYSYTMTGEMHTMRDAFGQFATGLLIAALLVYLVMVVQFRSFVDPFIVLLTIPLGLIGVVLFLFATGTALSIMSFMGIIMMVGIVVAYSVLLVDFANRRMEQGASVEDAITDAARVRIRPILMTAMAATLALTPMAIGGAGGEANAPLARAIIGGVLGATALTLFVTPALYAEFKRSRKTTATASQESATA
ncbi:efflux RND transporter permease subunit [candidate division KSB1 bacterium]|nr:efflux RND transporter permease subunit [candidate division KSB1 bacterium]